MELTLQTPIEYLKDVSPIKASILKKELQIYTLADLISYYPFRYEDRSQWHTIGMIFRNFGNVQLKGILKTPILINTGKKRLVATLKDETGVISLIWFQKISSIAKQLQPGQLYQVFGKVTLYQSAPVLIHPELSLFNPTSGETACLLPVYHTTEKSKKHYIDTKYIRRLQKTCLQYFLVHLPQTIPSSIRQQYQLMDRRKAIFQIHFPDTIQMLKRAQTYLKFEELFYMQLRLLQLREVRLEKNLGIVCDQSTLLHIFYQAHLPFPLTDAQKRVVKEIYADLRSGKQMNRLLQGDVGSGKTMVAFLVALLVVGSGGQVAMMAPTEILAEQHYKKWKELGESLNLYVDILTGSSAASKRKVVLAELAEGKLSILVGTHSLINEVVVFKNLCLAIIDEQQRFGVAQRAKLWQKSMTKALPHLLFMSATPIPRTLAMTLYGDLDVSTLNELPIGRKPIKTLHYYDAHRLKVFYFMRQQIAQGRQVYVVYPLIEESETMDYKNLLEGYESIYRAFPAVPLSIVHGKMKPSDKAYEMERFVQGQTKIMVATTVIEVGVNVPNATVMVIENADRFGLAQLHQLRGRVGRGSSQAYCILMTSYKLSVKTKERINCLVKTSDGFEIADADLRLRGPGDLMGVKQSGGWLLKIADLATDAAILSIARKSAKDVLSLDPMLCHSHHKVIKDNIDRLNQISWSHVS